MNSCSRQLRSVLYGRPPPSGPRTVAVHVRGGCCQSNTDKQSPDQRCNFEIARTPVRWSQVDRTRAYSFSFSFFIVHFLYGFLSFVVIDAPVVCVARVAVSRRAVFQRESDTRTAVVWNTSPLRFGRISSIKRRTPPPRTERKLSSTDRNNLLVCTDV